LLISVSKILAVFIGKPYDFFDSLHVLSARKL